MPQCVENQGSLISSPLPPRKRQEKTLRTLKVSCPFFRDVFSSFVPFLAVPLQPMTSLSSSGFDSGDSVGKGMCVCVCVFQHSFPDRNGSSCGFGS